jgi:glycosyltransferase involved in cell wall biosynthesis
MVNRPDAYTLFGGDTVLMRETARSLRKLGIEVTEVAGKQPPEIYRQFDIVHIFNLLTLHFSYSEAVKVKLAGKPLVLSTIYWNFEVEDRLSYNRKWKLLARCLGRRAATRGFTLWKSLKPYYREERKFQQQILKMADAWLVNSPSEIGQLATIIGTKGKATVAPNGIDASHFDPAVNYPLPAWAVKVGLASKSYALTVARIEPGKNQLGMLQAAKGSNIPFVLVGDETDPEYVRACREQGAVVTGKISDAELLASYAHARIHVLPSIRECPGLASLEAAAMECGVVSTNIGSAMEYLGPLAHYCHPFDQSGIRNAVMAAWSQPPPPHLSEKVRTEFTWDANAKITLEAYRKAAAKAGNSVRAVVTDTCLPSRERL